jgi:hypothetical protein
MANARLVEAVIAMRQLAALAVDPISCVQAVNDWAFAPAESVRIAISAERK